MAIKKEVEQELDLFVEGWEETPERSREVFLHFRECLNKKDGVTALLREEQAHTGKGSLTDYFLKQLPFRFSINID